MNTIPPRARFFAPRLWLAVALCSIAAALTGLALAGSAGWAVIASPNATGSSSNTLEDVTCVSASDCWAVGNFSGSGPLRTLIQHWDGASWSIIPSPNVVATGNNQSNQLFDVACSSASECWAVGIHTNQETYRTLILRWNGSFWSIVPSPNASTQGNLLVGVTCTSANDGWAVGGYYKDVPLEDIDATLIQHWNGTAWSIVPSPNYSDSNPGSTTSNGLSAVTCTSALDCWAVGGYKDILQPSRTLIARWNGTAWSLVPSPNTGPDDYTGLADVTCSSASDCWAVGDYYPPDDPEVPRTLIARWNGAAWALVPSGDPGSGRSLGSVTCPAASECWAVGSHIERWDGSAWSLFPSPAGARGVTCSSTAECWAVSQRAGPGFESLILRYGTSAVQASAAISRKTHGGAPFDINLPLTGARGIECRTGGANNDHQVVLTFPVAVSFASANLTTGTGNVSSTNGNGTAQVTVNLTGVTNVQNITLTLFGVNDGTNTNDVLVPMGVLVGDSNADGSVNSGDAQQTRNRSGQATQAGNFRSDVNTDGTINSGDAFLVRARSGTAVTAAP